MFSAALEKQLRGWVRAGYSYCRIAGRVFLAARWRAARGGWDHVRQVRRPQRHLAGDVGDVCEALRQLARGAPDAILLDNHLPGARGVDAIPALKEAAPSARVLMPTVSEDAQDLSAALQAGADGYLLKTVESDRLCEATVKVLDGDSVVSPDMTTKLVLAFRSRPAQRSPARIVLSSHVPGGRHRSDGLPPTFHRRMGSALAQPHSST
jgi:DNA-binding NarL/FixJ family response regulator